MAEGERKEWSLTLSGGGITGVASTSKQANFPQALEKFTGAKSYSEWIFEYVPPPRLQKPQPPGTKPPGPPVLRTF